MKQSESAEIRDTLFGDMPLSEWPPESSTPEQVEPWLSFVKARQQIETGDKSRGVETLRLILSMHGLESRHYLQAWHFLRELGAQPTADEAKRVYGVVVEVALENGLDIVAAYADGAARYFNYSGAAVIWERPDDSLDQATKALLEAGRTVAAQIGPWEGPRPSAPETGQVRISMLTPSGLHFGQGPFEMLMADPVGGPVISSAMQLMQGLIAKTEKG